MIRFAVSLTAALLLSGCFTSAQTAAPKAVVTTDAAITSPSGLKYTNTNVVSREAQPAVAKSGDNVGVHYTGWLTDGTQFDSSRASGKPFAFRLGTGAVIKGWDEGIAGMAVGDKRKLVIPAALGYGAAGSPPVIPSNAVLIFEVELMSIGK